MSKNEISVAWYTGQQIMVNAKGDPALIVAGAVVVGAAAVGYGLSQIKQGLID